MSKNKILKNSDIKKIQKNQRFLKSEDFSSMIEYEIDRTNRSNIEFSLVLISVIKTAASKRNIKKLIDHLTCNMRTTDHLGFLNSKTIGIILTSTSSKELSKFIEKLKKGSLNETWNFNYTVMTYPGSWKNADIKNRINKVIKEKEAM
jgi:hypothetical protein